MALITADLAYHGQRVKLLQPDSRYDIDEYNPAVGTTWECEGTITKIHNPGGIEVEWDNGYRNVYKDRELGTVQEANPSGRCQSIW